MSKFKKELENLNDEQKLLKRSESLIAHVWNTIVNGGRFTNDDLENTEELGIDIKLYFDK